MDPRCEKYRLIRRSKEIPGRFRGLTAHSLQVPKAAFGRLLWCPSALKRSLQLLFGCLLRTLQPPRAMGCLGQAHGGRIAISVRILGGGRGENADGAASRHVVVRVQ